ncbi:MAG: hypothetical protein HYV63_08815 [Candidatus Schekmanbacteria bacterium]|nr:hypothetical protein [Candidatus Schekmanbacteria bacterium]
MMDPWCLGQIVLDLVLLGLIVYLWRRVRSGAQLELLRSYKEELGQLALELEQLTEEANEAIKTLSARRREVAAAEPALPVPALAPASSTVTRPGERPAVAREGIPVLPWENDEPPAPRLPVAAAPAQRPAPPMPPARATGPAAPLAAPPTSAPPRAQLISPPRRPEADVVALRDELVRALSEQAGLQPAEIAALQAASVSVASGKLYLLVPGIRPGQEQRVPVPPAAIGTFRQYLELRVEAHAGDPLFCNRNNNPLSVRAIRDILGGASEQDTYSAPLMPARSALARHDDNKPPQPAPAAEASQGVEAEAEASRRAVYGLADTGLSVEEIARRMQRDPAEVRLILAFRRAEESTR